MAIPTHDPARPKGDIFVACAREDEHAVERLRAGLERYVDASWHVDRKFPELATERPQGIADAVRECDIFLSVFSRATAAKGDDYSWLELIWVEMWKKISPQGKHYVAVLIDDLPEPARREAHSFPDVKYVRLLNGEVSPEFGAQIRQLLLEAQQAEEPKYATRMAAPEQPGLLAAATVPVPTVEPKTPEKPLVHDENVQFTVYRPKTIVPQKWHTLLAFAHLSEKAPDASPDDPDPVQEVARQARQVLGDTDAYGQTTQDSTQAIPREGEITMVPMVEGIVFNPARHSFLWTEAVHREEFRLRIANEALLLPAVLRGRLTIYLGGLIIAEVPLKFQAEAVSSSTPAQNLVTAQARPYRKIFASYSHKDTPIVEHIEHYANAVGDIYLRDAVNLRSGQHWNAELMRMIEQADIFQLFWSSNSMRSKYCREEWEYALGLNRPDFIRPTYWEDPMPSMPHESLPPDELRSLHFQKIMSSRLPPSGIKPVPAPSRSSGRRSGRKIALMACLALVAVGGICFQYSRQNIMTASASSPQEEERQMAEALHKAQQEQETASAQKAARDEDQTATAQTFINTNSENDTASPPTFDTSSTPPQNQTADANWKKLLERDAAASTSPSESTAAPTNTPQVTQDQTPQPMAPTDIPPAAAAAEPPASSFSAPPPTSFEPPPAVPPPSAPGQ